MFKTLMSIIVVALLSVATIGVLAKPVQSTVQDQPQIDGTFEYAQLLVKGDLAELGDNGLRVRWILGGDNRVPQFVSVESLNRIITRRVIRPTFGNLLDSIGNQGWELEDVRQNSNGVDYWVFKRAR